MTPEAEQAARRDAYLATLDEIQRARFLYLERLEPWHVSEDLICADCGSKLVLRLGRYGRFYGCEKYQETGCKGGVSARHDGTPKGWPGDAATRRARFHLVRRLEAATLAHVENMPPLEEDVATFRKEVRAAIARFLDKPEDFSIGELTREECERVLEAWDGIVNAGHGRTLELLRILFDPQTDYDPEWP